MKKNMNKTIAMALALAVVGSTAAYAAGTEKATTNTTTNQDVSVEQTENAQAEVETGYITNTGKVTEIENTEDGNKVVTIENQNGGLRFVVSATTMIVDRVTNEVITADKLTKDMQVSVVYDAMSPMGMSLPPYLGNVTAVVANADKGNVCVGMFNNELVNEKEKLQLNVEKETKVLTTLGTKMILGAEDIKGKNAVVFYDATTRSIPAQTSPSLVLLLEEKEAVVEEAPAEAQVAKVKTEAKSVVLRDAAMAKGYKVIWKGKAEPVVLEKDGQISEITIGSATYVVEGDMAMKASMPAQLKDGVLYVSSEVIDNLK